jgi:hypothetical protein
MQYTSSRQSAQTASQTSAPAPHSAQDSASQPTATSNAAAVSTATSAGPLAPPNPIADEQLPHNFALAALSATDEGVSADAAYAGASQSGMDADSPAATEFTNAPTNDPTSAPTNAEDIASQDRLPVAGTNANQQNKPAVNADAGTFLKAANSILEPAASAAGAAAGQSSATTDAMRNSLGEPQSPVAAKPAPHAANQPPANDQQAVATDVTALAAQAKDQGVRNLQLFTNPATRDPQALPRHNSSALPDVASLIAGSAQNSSPDQNRSIAENRQSIAQQIQARLAPLGGSQQPSSVQVTGATSGSSDSAASGQNGSGPSASGQSANHSGGGSSQTASPARPSDDSKSATASTDSSQSNPQAADAPADSPRVKADATSATVSTSAGFATSDNTTPLHVSAQAMAQSDAAGSAAASKAAANAAPESQPAVSSPLPASLPRSLSDVTQATQLYQRVGGAEMHISMDTDLLGSIDLRAVVHQGSLSATIGVQRADVQTLLVNELPALQHSLSEKNLQVGQISVLAGNIGSGANGDAQSHQQQGRPQTSAPIAPLYRDEELAAAPAPRQSAMAGMAAATIIGSSARLSVLA